MRGVESMAISVFPFWMLLYLLYGTSVRKKPLLSRIEYAFTGCSWMCNKDKIRECEQVLTRQYENQHIFLNLVTQSIESADGRGIQIVTSCVKVPLVDRQCRLCMASQRVCCKLVHVYFIGEPFLSCMRKPFLLFSWLNIR
jgi:hypothetical protein